MMGLREEKKTKKRIEQKKPPFGYLPISQSIIWRLTVFRSPKGPKTRRTFPSGREGNKLMG